MIGRRKKAAFEEIKSLSMEANPRKLLSQVGREIVIKAALQCIFLFFLDVLQCIPTCAISSFHILVGLCSELNKKMSNFWWEQLLTSYFLTIQN